MVVFSKLNIHTKATLSGVAQDFMVFMWGMGLSQVITGPTYLRGHIPDLVYYTDGEVDLHVGELKLTPLSWPDHFLTEVRLTGSSFLYGVVDPLRR